MMTISKDTFLKGELRSKGKIKVDGHIEGYGSVAGTLILTHHADWKGDIVVESAIIDGYVKGNIFAKQSVILLNNADVTGDIFSQSINIHLGAKYTGRLHMQLCNDVLTSLIKKLETCKNDNNGKHKQKLRTKKLVVNA